ncbi:MAG TPA: class I SAM-dependent methyltransferase [Pirellulales bacterium]|nr:class I SAM-dependent methyltransferase [Pirellulales bacterium]
MRGSKSESYFSAEPQAESKRCDLCDGTDFELIARHDRRGKELPTGLCTACGLVSHWKIPSEVDLQDFYATHYRREYHGETTPSARRVMRAWRTAKRIQRQVGPSLAPGSDVFDVGAGIGCVAKVFELAGHPASGIEPNFGFQDFSKNQLRARVESGDLWDVPRQAACDTVLLIHVIEHFRSPRQALRHIHGILKPGGQLYVECPNLGAPFTTRPKLFHLAHIHNFTPATLEMLARRCGFEIVRWFSKPADPNLQVLLRRIETEQLEIIAGSYRQTMAALERFGPWSYHLRLSYLLPRAVKLLSYALEYAIADRYVTRILGNCAAAAEAAAKAAEKNAPADSSDQRSAA